MEQHSQAMEQQSKAAAKCSETERCNGNAKHVKAPEKHGCDMRRQGSAGNDDAMDLHCTVWRREGMATLRTELHRRGKAKQHIAWAKNSAERQHFRETIIF